ncbi:hypothetical protein OA416_02525 [Paracoccaceae bacterium]|nr:hypothetical protein [Paracoccaceae bacterium]
MTGSRVPPITSVGQVMLAIAVHRSIVAISSAKKWSVTSGRSTGAQETWHLGQ